MSTSSSSSNARISRSYLAAKVVSMVRENQGPQLFKPHELVNLEASLRDELTKNQWICNLFNSIVNDGVCLSHDELQMISESVADGKVGETTLTEVETARSKLQFVEGKLKLMRVQREKLQRELEEGKRKLAAFQAKVDADLVLSRKKVTSYEYDCKELISQLKNELLSSSDACSRIRDPKVVVNEILTELNRGNDHFDDERWLEAILDDLTLTDLDKEVIIDAFYSRLHERLANIKEEMLRLHEECFKLKSFYTVNVSEEMEWRDDLKQLIEEILTKPVEKKGVNVEEKVTDSEKKQTKVVPLKLQNIATHINANDDETDEVEFLAKELQKKIECLQQKYVDASSATKNVT